MSEKPQHISITTGTMIRAVLVLATAWALVYLKGIVLNVLTAIVIASAIEPGIAKLQRNKVPRLLAILYIYVSLFLLFFAIFYFFLPTLIDEVMSFVAALPGYLQALGTSGPLAQYSQFLSPSPTTFSVDHLMNGLRSALNVNGAFSSTFAAFSTIFGGIFSLIFIIVFSFYFAIAKTSMDDFLSIVTPDGSRAYVLDLWRRSRDKIGLWMQGQLLLGVIMGVLVYLGLTILGVNHALLLALLASMFEIIPVFGPTLSAIPAVAIAFGDGGMTLGLLTIALYVIAQQFENHLIYPLVVTRVVGVSPLLIILSLIIGGELAGFLGIVLSVPIAATVQEFVNDLQARRARITIAE